MNKSSGYSSISHVSSQNAEEILNKIMKSTNEGMPLSSIFIPNSEKLYNGDVINKMWKYFTTNNKLFITKFGVAKWNKSIDISKYAQGNVDKKYVEAYENIWKPFFQGFIEECSSNKYTQLFCSFNNSSFNNICIIFDNSRFFAVTIKNNHMATDMMNDALIKMEKFGQFVHVLITQ